MLGLDGWGLTSKQVVRMQLVRYCHMGSIGTVRWSAEKGQALCCDWTGENGGGHGFREFAIFVCSVPQVLPVRMTKK